MLLTKEELLDWFRKNNVEEDFIEEFMTGFFDKQKELEKSSEIIEK